MSKWERVVGAVGGDVSTSNSTVWFMGMVRSHVLQVMGLVGLLIGRA